MPPARSGRLAVLRAPLVFDPGERWEYSIATDWVGRAVEAGGLTVTDESGVVYNPLADRWSLSLDTAVNYMVTAARAASNAAPS